MSSVGRKKGTPKTGGRRKGSPNKITRTFREAMILVFEELGGTTHLKAWARDNPTEFYKIAARLIPTEIMGKDGGPIETRSALTYSADAAYLKMLGS